MNSVEKQVYSAEWDTGEPFGTNLNKENQRLYSKMSPDLGVQAAVHS